MEWFLLNLEAGKPRQIIWWPEVVREQVGADGGSGWSGGQTSLFVVESLSGYRRKAVVIRPTSAWENWGQTLTFSSQGQNRKSIEQLAKRERS